mgnify:CR=1 FL=1
MSGRLEDFTLEQLSIMIVAVMGACAGLLAVVFRSKCSSISCCGIKIERDPEAITDPDVQKEVVAQRRASINNLPNLPQDQEDPRP